MKAENRGGLERNGRTHQAGRAHEAGAESGNHSIHRPKVRRSVAGAIEDKKLVLE